MPIPDALDASGVFDVKEIERIKRAWGMVQHAMPCIVSQAQADWLKDNGYWRDGYYAVSKKVEVPSVQT